VSSADNHSWRFCIHRNLVSTIFRNNADQAQYIDWFLPFAQEIHRVLKPDGSFVLNLGGSWVDG